MCGAAQLMTRDMLKTEVVNGHVAILLAVACLAHLCGAGQLPRAALLHDTGCVRSHHLSVRSSFTTPAAAGTLVLGYGPRHKN